MSTRIGPLNSGCAAKLLLAAAAVDIALVILLAQLVSRMSFVNGLVKSWVDIFFSGDELNAAVVVVLILPCLLFYWFIVEVILGGHSLGRLAMQITPRATKDGQPLKFGQNLRRGMWKLGTCGLSGCHPSKPALYDRKAGVTWHSPMAPRPRRPIQKWELRVKTGNHATSIGTPLSQFPIFRDPKNRHVKIGRNLVWADIALPGDMKVSSQHCVIHLVGRSLMIRDLGSSNHTYLGGRKLTPKKDYSLQGYSEIRVGDVVIEIER